MGRFTSVQAYSDTNAGMRSVSYDQAKGPAPSEPSASSSVKPEKVVNPYGSTAGAGSGEFHVYRQARAREAQRMQQLQEEEGKKTADQAFREQLRQNDMECEARTNKRRMKRERQKQAKQRKLNLMKSGVNLSSTPEGGTDAVKKEFVYERDSDVVEDTKQAAIASDKIKEKEVQSEVETAQQKFASDGSFLEMIKNMKQAEDIDRQQIKGDNTYES